MIVNVIGAGLAGCECSYILARNNIQVRLYEMKKIKKSEVHKSDNFAELVCSNSLKSESITNACGLLKKEMSFFDSLFLEAAYNSKVEAGQALAVDRDLFSKYITDKINMSQNITIIDKEIKDINEIIESGNITVIATGPLTTYELSMSIQKLLGNSENLYFYDAASPIVDADSIDYSKAYSMDRYSNSDGGDYLNLGMNKEEYIAFYNSLITAKEAPRHDFDKLLFLKVVCLLKKWQKEEKRL